jgi:hypothetical protein
VGGRRVGGAVESPLRWFRLQLQDGV